jgi:hypothetical protein
LADTLVSTDEVQVERNEKAEAKEADRGRIVTASKERSADSHVPASSRYLEGI